MGKEKAAADWDVGQLENYPRRALQGFCKQVGIRANQKTVDLIAALRAYHYSFACSSSSEAESVVDEESSDRSHLSEHEQSELMEEEEEQEEEHDEEEEPHNDQGEAEAQEEEEGAVGEEEEPHNDEEEEGDVEAEAEAQDDEEGEVDAEEEEHEEDEEDAEALQQQETDHTEKDESLDAVLPRNQNKAEPTGAEETRRQGTNNDKMDVEHGDSILSYRSTIIVEEEHKKPNLKPDTNESLSKKNEQPMSIGEVVVHQRRRSAFPHLDRLVGSSCSSSSSSSSLASIPTNSRTVEQNRPLKPVDEPQHDRNEATQTETEREEALRRKYTEELEAMLEQQRAQYRSQLREKQQQEDEKKEKEAKNEREREAEETRTTENVNNTTKTKTKDWDKIHAKQFEKMDSIADYLQRKEKSSAAHSSSSSAAKHNTSFTAAKSEKHVSSINNKKVLKRKAMTETAPSSSSKTEPQQLDQKTPNTKTECSTIPSSSRLNRTVSSTHLSLGSKHKSCSSTNTSIIDATPSSTAKKLTSFASQRQLRTPGNPTPAVHRQRCNTATTTPSSLSSKRALVVRDPREALLASAPRTPSTTSTTNNQVTKHKLSYTPHKGPLPKFEWNPLSLAATSSTSSAASSSSASPLQKTMRKTATMIARASSKKDEMRRKLNSVGSKKKKEKREEAEDENHNKNKSNMEEEGKNESERKQSKTGLMRELKNRMTPIKQKIAGGERRGSKEKVFKTKDQKREQFLSKRLESRKETLSSKRDH
ncbi:Histone-fold-containing [Balamuthia mandrillaris]